MAKALSKPVRWLLIAAGSFFTALGAIGIFLPILPTTPFLLLAAACFARSSDRFYRWLLGNRWVGGYIKNYREGRGISLRAKILVISALWFAIFVSALLVPVLLVRIILILVAAAVSAHILSIKTLK